MQSLFVDDYTRVISGFIALNLFMLVANKNVLTT